MMDIRDVRPADLPQIAEIEKQCFSSPWTVETLATQLNPERYIFIAAVEEDCILGYVGLMYVQDEGYISNVAVAPACRRRGIGDLLIAGLEVRAQEKQLAFMTLEVRASNDPARALYQKHGFSDVGIRKNYYEKPREDAILMTKLLQTDAVCTD